MPKPRILVVDDNEQIQALLRDIFSIWGIESVGFEDPFLAVGEVQQNYYNMIFLDVHMPQISGIELLETLTKTCHDTEIVMMTGSGTLETEHRALENGAFAFLAKPFELDVLSRVVNSALRRQQGVHLTGAERG
jgi:DNA-binding NtrC family response regulator